MSDKTLDQEVEDSIRISVKRTGGRIEHWSYSEVDLDRFVVTGVIYDDDLYNDGEFIRTSLVLEINEIENIIVTRTTIYSLGSKR